MNNGILLATESGTINLNVDQKTLDMCVKTTNNYTSTIYHNICNGEIYTVGAGSFGVTFNIVATIIGVLLVFLLLKGLFKMFFEY